VLILLFKYELAWEILSGGCYFQEALNTKDERGETILHKICRIRAITSARSEGINRSGSRWGDEREIVPDEVLGELKVATVRGSRKHADMFLGRTNNRRIEPFTPTTDTLKKQDGERKRNLFSEFLMIGPQAEKESRWMAVVAKFLSLGCDPAVQNAEGNTALHVACELGHLGIIMALLSSGKSVKHLKSESEPTESNINAQNAHGNTALHTTFSGESWLRFCPKIHADLVTWLLSHGVDPQLANRDGKVNMNADNRTRIDLLEQTALHVACDLGNDDAVIALLAHPGA
jgi:ankyrin repeat protein